LPALFAAFASLAPSAGLALAAVLEVPAGYATIQAALDAASAGDTIHVASGTYAEKIEFTSGGDGTSGPIVLAAAPGAPTKPVLDGTGVSGSNMVLIDSKSYVSIVGFEITNNLGVNDGSGIRVVGAGTDIEIRDNTIHEIRGQHAMGITVYGTEAQPIENLVIDGNEIFDCDPARSEALTLNGNVTNFEVTNNVVRDVNNIAIDFIGGETDIQPNASLVARNGVVRGNVVARANSSYGGGFAAGIYVDGGRDIVIENNSVTESDLGIEIGAENQGLLTENVIVRNNLVYRNEKAGLVFGGYAASAGRANNNEFRGNTFYDNNTLGQAGNGEGEIWIQYAENNVFENNIVYADGSGDEIVVASFGGAVGNVLNHNVYATRSGSGGEFSLNDDYYTGFAAWQAGSGSDADSAFSDPGFADPDVADFHISASSPAFNAGNPSYVADVGETDLDGAARVSGVAVDCGADEAGCGNNMLDPGENCDDGNVVDGDGCDSNCALTGCGNGIVTAGEDCDDGNVIAGDCCAGDCSFESPAAPCSDASPCSDAATCDGAGACVPDFAPAPLCPGPLSPRGGALKLKNKNGKASLSWKWGKGPAVDRIEFGDPVTMDDYTLCLHATDGPEATLLVETAAPAGPDWEDREGKGFRYKTKDLLPDGLKQVHLRPGEAGKAKFKIKGKGPNLRLPVLGLDPASTVHAQLRGPRGICFGLEFPPPFAKNDPTSFSDKTD
jgi:cysteine-rich repeat protein/parallel beta-helix repeat protein